MTDPILTALQLLLNMAHADDRFAIEWMIAERMKAQRKDAK